MAEGASSVPHVPYTWIGQEVHVIYVGTATTHDSLDCVLQEVNNMGIAVVAGELSSFLPWSSVIKLDLGHAAAMRVR